MELDRFSYDHLRVDILPPAPSMVDILAYSVRYFTRTSAPDPALLPCLHALPQIDTVDWDDLPLCLAQVTEFTEHPLVQAYASRHFETWVLDNHLDHLQQQQQVPQLRKLLLQQQRLLFDYCLYVYCRQRQCELEATRSDGLYGDILRKWFQVEVRGRRDADVVCLLRDAKVLCLTSAQWTTAYPAGSENNNNNSSSDDGLEQMRPRVEQVWCEGRIWYVDDKEGSEAFRREVHRPTYDAAKLRGCTAVVVAAALTSAVSQEGGIATAAGGEAGATLDAESVVRSDCAALAGFAAQFLTSSNRSSSSIPSSKISQQRLQACREGAAVVRVFQLWSRPPFCTVLVTRPYDGSKLRNAVEIYVQGAFDFVRLLCDEVHLQGSVGPLTSELVEALESWMRNTERQLRSMVAFARLQHVTTDDLAEIDWDVEISEWASRKPPPTLPRFTFLGVCSVSRPFVDLKAPVMRALGLGLRLVVSLGAEGSDFQAHRLSYEMGLSTAYEGRVVSCREMHNFTEADWDTILQSENRYLFLSGDSLPQRIKLVGCLQAQLRSPQAGGTNSGGTVIVDSRFWPCSCPPPSSPSPSTCLTCVSPRSEWPDAVVASGVLDSARLRQCCDVVVRDGRLVSLWEAMEYVMLAGRRQQTQNQAQQP